jgi:hypothetical protein
VSVLSRIAAPALLLVLCADASALAQEAWQDRAFINVNLGFRPETVSFDEFLTPVIYDEHATLFASHRIDGGLTLLDVSGGVRLRGNLGIGGTFSRFSPVDTTTVDASVPHPSLFNRPRRASATVTPQHVETAYHFAAVWMIPLRTRIDVALSAGPSVIFVSQDLVSGIAIAEDSPSFATVAIAKVDLGGGDQHVLGANAGADVTYFISRMVGVGGTVRYVVGTADLTRADGSRVSVKAGGLQFGVGVRLRIR